ncbi:hypothetical protein BTO30_16505, partial [Domibacillus antri]
KLAAYYPHQIGRPSKDPVVLVKILMIQYLEGFRPVRFTCSQVKQNATYRWFLGIPLEEKVPDHSTISKFLSQRLKNEVFWEGVFHHCLRLIRSEGFIANETWVADETELKANANKRVREAVAEEKVTEEKEDDLAMINDCRVRHGLKPLKAKGPKTEVKKTNISPVDGDARLSPWGKILRSVRPATVELSFAHSKELHGLRYARYRGVQKVRVQVLMTAIIQNLKKWTKLRSLKQVGLHLTYQIIEETALQDK